MTATNPAAPSGKPLLPRYLLPILAVGGLSLATPFIAALLGGAPLGEMLKLPLTERAWDPLPPSALFTFVLNGLALTLLILTALLARPVSAARHRIEPPVPGAAPHPVPRFVWFGVFALLLAIMAADGGALNATIGLVTLAVTFFVNAHTQRRTSSCLLTQRTGYFWSLFGASLGAGWLFYWLNLFLGLWTYPGASETVPFIIGKSLHYAVLLPALLSLRQWLASFPPVLGATSRAAPLAGSSTPQEGWILLALALFGLAGAALWPDWIYPLTLTAPLLLSVAVQQIRRKPTPFAGLATGDWSRLLLPAAAAIGLAALAQALNLAIGPGWTLSLSQLGGPSLLGLPLPAWVWIALLGPFGVWLGDQLTRPYQRNPQRPPPRVEFPVRIEISSKSSR